MIRRAQRLLLSTFTAGWAIAMATAPAAAARAIVTPFSWEVTLAYEGPLPSECLSDGLTATYGPVTEFGSGEMVENANGVLVRGRDGMTYSFDLSDGRHVDGSAAGTFTSIERNGVVVFTDSILEPRTIYSADGGIVGRVVIHVFVHAVFDQASGTTRASIDRFFFTCA